MPKNVQMPDGTVIAFPDNMDDATIHAEGLKYINKIMAPPPPVDQRARNAQQVRPVEATPGAVFENKTGLDKQGKLTPSSYLSGNATNVTDMKNNAIDILRNILPPAAGTFAGAAATPYTGGLGTAAAGTAAYTGVDALLRQLKVGNQETVPESLKDSLIQAAINEAGGRIVAGTWAGAKAFLKSDQPEILKFLPTASQALKAEGKFPSISGILKYIEDHFAPGTKAAAQERSASASNKLFEQRLVGSNPNVSSTNPYTIANDITEQLPAESVKVVKPPVNTPHVGNNYTPIKIVEEKQTVPYQPIKVSPKPPEPAPPTYKPSGKGYREDGLIQGSVDNPVDPNLYRTDDIKVTKNISAPKEIPYADKSHDLRVTDVVKDVPSGLPPKLRVERAGPTTPEFEAPNTSYRVPREHEVIPGVVKEVPYATDPASLDKLLTDPKRLQKALSDSQASGVGYNARKDLASYRLARIQQVAAEVQPNGAIRLNPQKLFEELNNPAMQGANELLFSKSDLSNIGQFYKNVAATQEKAQGFGGFGKLRLATEGIVLSTGIAHALIAENVAPLAYGLAPIGVEIGLAGLARTLTKTRTARLMLALANNEALGVSDQYAARQIMQTIQGATGNLINKDGSKTPFQVKNGQMVPVGDR